MKTMKKVGAIVLALCMCMSLCVTAFAASSDDTTGRITIDGAIANETYTIYQIFELTYTDYEEGETPDSYSYKVVDEWEDFIKSYSIGVVNDGGRVETVNLFTLTENGYLEPTSAIYDYENDADVVAAFARAALAYAAEAEIEGTASASFAWSDEYNRYVVTGGATIGDTDEEGGYVYANMTFSDLDLGWYLVDTSLGSLCMLTSTDPDAEISEKNGTPTVSKKVHENSYEDYDDETWGTEDEADNNDHIRFELRIDNINGSTNLVLHDSMDDELVIDYDEFADSNFHMDGVYLYTSEDDGNPTLLTEAAVTYDENGTIVSIGEGDYYITVGTCTVEGCTLTGCAFEVHFLRDFNDVSSEAYVMVFYNLLLVTDGDGYVNDYEEIDNYATVTFATSSQSPIVEAETYSFGFEIFKYTEAEYEGVGYQYVINESATYDINAGGDTYCLAYIDYSGETDDDGEYVYTIYYAVFDLGDWDLNSDETFVITAWVEDQSQATTWDEGTEDVTVNLTFYTNTLPNDDLDVHVIEILEIESLSDIDPQEFEGEELAGGSEGSQTPLANAEFQITNAAGQTAYFMEENVTLDDGTIRHIYLLEGWGTIPEGSNYTDTVISGEDGMIYVEGLDLGTYTLTETKAPDGYNLLDASITVSIWATFDEETGLMTDHGVTWTLGSDSDSGVVNVLNNAGAELPGTGGMGVYIFYIVGGCLVVAAAVVLITRRRVNRAE